MVLAAAVTVVISPLPSIADPGTPVPVQDAASLLAVKAHELEKITERFNTAR